MIILAADTSTSRGSVAVRDPEGNLWREDLEEPGPHSQTLLPSVEKVLGHAGLTRGDVEAIAVGIGPGAFTGLRVGLATFKAWAAASRLPLVPVVSMDAVALPALMEGGSAVVLADARKGEVYAGYYASLTGDLLPLRQGDILLMPHERAQEWIHSLNDPGPCLTGTGLTLLTEKGLLESPHCKAGGPGAPDARWLLAMAEILLPMGRTVEPQGLIPYYVRPPDASKPSPGTMITTSSGGDH